MEIAKTSNPSIVKFVSDSFLTKASSYEFKNIDEAKNSSLAQQLFYLPFVKTVYISQNFVAIEKYNIVEWEDVQEEVAESISEYIKSGKPVVTEAEVVAPKKLPVSIYAESTPNPTVMKFVANKTLAKGTFEFKSVEDAILSPLAQALFNFPFVKEVFISNNYVSVTKHNMIDWEEISMEIREFLRQYVQDDKLIVKDEITKASNISNNIGSADSSPEKDEKNYSDIEKEIISILDEYVKPAVARDGGNIMFDSFNESSKTVKVVLQGACSGCPSSTITLKNGIETMLKELMKGQVESVVAING
ncbi:NifU family protein [Aequorivita sp. KMM 9714]|uniref:NifU family protein n=1 Tax=Aequorivita sp. KMM 9714 TaxID=2707173 RepID=UPI0013ED48DF|nr:NifU family protein [Aequorivita sp. KMM 9714]NGX83360.1 NifU family protein [Aequorivita sp. KMM 9714]